MPMRDEPDDAGVKTLYRKIEAVRLARNFQKQDVARALGRDPTKYSGILRGQGDVEAYQLASFCRFAGVSADWMVDDGIDPEPVPALNPTAAPVLTEAEIDLIRAVRRGGGADALLSRLITGLPEYSRSPAGPTHGQERAAEEGGPSKPARPGSR
jgi:transcriptional regulator with XRE-family HTH domain